MKNRKEEPFQGTVLLSGTIVNLKRSKRSHDFVLTQVQQSTVGATAIGAAAMGMGAASIGLTSMAMNSDEEAEWVEFELDGKQVQGWMWLLPMRNGDEVDVVAESLRDGRYIAYAIKRKGDDLLAVYPHATSGRKAHYRAMTRQMLWTFLFVYTIVSIGFYVINDNRVSIEIFLLFTATEAMITFIGFGILFYRAARKLVVFAYISEAIFRTYKWPDVENIDLRKTSREHRRENSLPNYGRLYFRYK